MNLKKRENNYDLIVAQRIAHGIGTEPFVYTHPMGIVPYIVHAVFEQRIVRIIVHAVAVYAFQPALI